MALTVSHLTPDFVDALRAIARGEASRVWSEIGMRSRPALQGAGAGGGTAWDLDVFEIAGTPLTISNSGGSAILTFNEVDIRNGLVRKDAGLGGLESVESFFGMATMWFTMEWTTPGSKPSPPNWYNHADVSIADDYYTNGDVLDFSDERNFDHLSASSTETAYANFTHPIDADPAAGITITVTNSGTVWDFDITAGGVVFYGYNPNA